MIGYVSFTFSLPTGGVIRSRFIYGAANVIISFFSLANIPSVHGGVLLCPPICWWTFWLPPYLGYCNTVQCRFACLCLSNSLFLDYRSRSGPAGSYGSSMFTFLRHLHSVLIRGPFEVTSPLKLRVCISPQQLQHLLFVVFLLMVFLTSVSWYPFVVEFACAS